jgi:hypothetical protein
MQLLVTNTIIELYDYNYMINSHFEKGLCNQSN